MITRLTLVRHGTTEWMEKGLIHGRLDAPLSPAGIRQVQATAALLRGRQFDAFYSSPTGRAWQTAQIISPVIGLSPEPLDLLVEGDFGAIEGTPVRNRPSSLRIVMMLFAWTIPIGKGAEPPESVYRRGVKVIELMAREHSSGSVLLVSHSGLINMILRKITGHRYRFFLIPPASITETEINAYGKGSLITDVRTSILPKPS